MKNRELFNRTIDILVKAYQNDTLAHSQCAACAVGNIILASYGTKPIEETPGNFSWDYKTVDYSHNGITWFGVVNQGVPANQEISNFLSKTGYSISQLRDIEAAFESGAICDSDGYKGIMSVVDTLMQIHEANTDEVTEAKSLFVKV